MSVVRAEFVSMPASGRRFATTAKVRLGDVGRDGRLRLDALARHLQDIASDDSSDAGIPRAHAWLVRRTAVDIISMPRLGEELSLVTFCSGRGGRWAERRTSITGSHGGRVEAEAIWVCTDVATGRPVTPPPEFDIIYGESAGGRRVSARLTLGEAPEDADRRAWPLRHSDFDILDHMNNASYWAAVDDEVARQRIDVARRAVVEYRAAIESHHKIELVSSAGPPLAMWLAGDGTTFAAALVEPA